MFRARHFPRDIWRKIVREGLLTKAEKIEAEGTVVEALPNTMFKVKLEDDGPEVLAYLAGRMKKYYIKVLLGDQVRVELSPYDLTRGRITYRHRVPPRTG